MPHRPEQYGTTCRLGPMDLVPGATAAAGDVIATRAGSYYLVTDARRVMTSVHPNRWSLGVVRLDPADVDEVDWRFGWYRRSRG